MAESGQLAGAARLAASFRDPDGFLFESDGVLYRQVNRSCAADYDRLMGSGLYGALTEAGLLIPHEEAGDVEPAEPAAAHRVLRPERVPFISYPYEWCFSQLKDAALLTLDLQRRALGHGMSLKDASAYNVQFLGGRPVFIDTISFEPYKEGAPWVAYRQFCQHFLAPLALMARVDARLNQLLVTNLDGVPLDLASALLPRRSLLRFGLLVHLHLHARAQRAFGGKGKGAGAGRSRGGSVGRTALLGLLDSLSATVRGLRWAPEGTEWADYYSDTNYSRAGLEHKARLVSEWLDLARPSSVWDLGANTGHFSRLAAEKGVMTVAFDLDPACVERAYLDASRRGDRRLLPLRLDLTNPSPAIGWRNRERMSFPERGPADAALALALVHHLAISGNVPLAEVAAFFGRACRWLIIEFVPKSDSQVARLLASREDVFGDYDQAHFESYFGRLFTIERSERIADSERTLYLMRSGAD